MNFVGHYMRDRAYLWYVEYIEGRVGLTWGRFYELLLVRFRPTSKDDVLVEFSTLFYENDLNVYELKAFVRVKYPTLDDEFFMSKFLGGLPMELRLEVLKFWPRTLEEMVSITKLKEHRLSIFTLQIW